MRRGLLGPRRVTRHAEVSMHNERCHGWKGCMIETCVFLVWHCAASRWPQLGRSHRPHPARGAVGDRLEPPVLCPALGKRGQGAPGDSRDRDTHHQCGQLKRQGFARTVPRLNGPHHTVVQPAYSLHYFSFFAGATARGLLFPRRSKCSVHTNSRP